MKRNRLITILLVVAGIALAFGLFGAGFLWRAKFR
jgi:cytochrome c-type biogenesis protein CcmE